MDAVLFDSFDQQTDELRRVRKELRCQRCIITLLLLLVLSLTGGVAFALVARPAFLFTNPNHSQPQPDKASPPPHPLGATRPQKTLIETSFREEVTGPPKLIFNDEFTTFDLNKWDHAISAYGGGNWEFEYYTNNRSNSYVRNGTLFIKPTLTEDRFRQPNFLMTGLLDLWGTVPADQCTAGSFYGCFRQGSGTNYLNPIQSARIRTAKSFTFRYGTISIRMKLPRGDWIWPAFWLVPIKNQYGKWPASGEIDLIEARGNNGLSAPGSLDGPEIGISSIGTTQHWGPFFGEDPFQKTHTKYSSPSGLFSDAFHVWNFTWDPSGLVGSVDGQQYVKFPTPSTGWFDYGGFSTLDVDNPWLNGAKNAPFDQEFYMIMNVAVGGTAGFFPDGSTSKPQNGLPPYAKPWSDKSQTAPKDFYTQKNMWYPTWEPTKNNGENAAMQVDYVRVYSLDSSKHGGAKTKYTRIVS